MATAVLDDRYNVQISNAFELLQEDKPKEKKNRPNRRARQKAAQGQKEATAAASTGAAPTSAPAKPAGTTKPQATKEGEAQTKTVKFTKQPAVASPSQEGDRPLKSDRSDRPPRKERTDRTDRSRPNTRESKKVNRDQRRDRHPGSGRGFKETNKRGGGGARNWGKPGDELQAEIDDSRFEDVEEEKETSSKSDAPKAEGAKEGEGAQEGVEGKEGAKEGEAKEGDKKGKDGEDEDEDGLKDEDMILFDDYQKAVQDKRPKLSLPPPRKAGEGVEENPEWAKAIVKKDEELTGPTVDANKGAKDAKKNKAGAPKKKEKGVEKVPITDVLKIQPRRTEGGRGRGRGRGRRDFGDDQPRGGRGDRGDRGDRWPRGGRGDRSGGRGDRPKKFQSGGKRGGQPNFDDKSFPALSPNASAGAAAVKQD